MSDAFDKKAAEKLFDENIEEHRRFYADGFTNRMRSSDPLPESIQKLPEPLGKIVELGYQDAAEGLKPRVPVNLPKKYFEPEPEPPKAPPAPEPPKPPSPTGGGTGPKAKNGTDVPKPKAEEEFIPPTDQAKYWYLQGYARVSVREPPEFTKWYRTGLRDRTASLPARVAAQTQPAPAPGGSDLTLPLVGLGGAALIAAIILLSRRKRNR